MLSLIEIGRVVNRFEVPNRLKSVLFHSPYYKLLRVYQAIKMSGIVEIHHKLSIYILENTVLPFQLAEKCVNR